MSLFVWQDSKKPDPVKGQKRIVLRLILSPRLIAGEWRWLGLEYIEQEYQVEESLDYDQCGGLYTTTNSKWVDHAWVFQNIRKQEN